MLSKRNFFAFKQSLGFNGRHLPRFKSLKGANAPNSRLFVL
jgi:hypothetical protein